MTIRKQPISTVLDILKNVIGHSDWFIAGSYAIPKVKTPNDIDVFFLSPDKYPFSEEYLSANKDIFILNISENAVTLRIVGIEHIVQFVTCRTGTVEEIFSEFDLNICKRAILPNGKRVVDSTARKKLYISKCNIDTFNRYFKYLNAYDNPKVLDRHAVKLIDIYIGDTTILEEYYEDHHFIEATNKLLFDKIMSLHVARDYLLEQTKLISPEILL